MDSIESPIGAITLVVDDGKLCLLEFEDHQPGIEALLARRYDDFTLEWVADPRGFSNLLRRYFAGDLNALESIQVSTAGTEFQQQVWQALKSIPAGQTLSYRELAQRVGRPSAMRAVGAANGANPVALVLPCHRVIGADGSLTGYGGGLHRKEWLLRHERALA
jgi:methylated-DNA-[protein]-cysteine S-methyltransferase